MNIVIQNVKTRRFMTAPPNDWVADPRDALPFNGTRAALAYCRRHELEEVRLVVFFADRKVSLLLYVPGSETPVPGGALKHVAA